MQSHLQATLKRRTSPKGFCTPFRVCLHRINKATKRMYVSFISFTQKGVNIMAITSGYKPMGLTAPEILDYNTRLHAERNGQATKTLTPVSQPKPVQVSQPKPEPKPVQVSQPKPESNLSYTASEKQPIQVSEPEPEQQDKSTKRFALRLTVKQRNQLRKLKKSWGLSTESAVIKKLIDDSKEENNISNLSHQITELTEIKTELNRIGININQIAKKANQLNMTADELNAVMQYMNDVCEVIYGKGLKQ